MIKHRPVVTLVLGADAAGAVDQAVAVDASHSGAANKPN